VLFGCASAPTERVVTRPEVIETTRTVVVTFPVPAPCIHPILPNEPPTWLGTLELLVEYRNLLNVCGDKLEQVRERVKKEGASAPL
jgi:hypothetical protein